MSTTQRDDRPLATELKFLIPARVGDQIRTWARREMAPDPHATGPDRDTYQTTTLYVDTAELDVFHRRGSFGRSKYRIRRYGVSDLVFLERKMRTRDRLSKRRSQVPIDTLARLSTSAVDTEWAGGWWHRRVAARQLRPTCVIRYQRMARLAMSATGPLRLTVDQHLEAWAESDVSVHGQPTCPDVINGHAILELKFRQNVPALFKQLVVAFHLTPQKLSKYRAALSALRLAPADTAAAHTETTCSNC